MPMNRIRQTLIWLARMPHSRGFGIQSPTDYQFVRYVVNEKWPYYAYSKLDEGHGWLQRKIGHLMLRLANWRQPKMIVDMGGYGDYLLAGCQTAQIVADVEVIELACVPIACNIERVFSKCNEQSVVVFHELWRHRSLWHCIEQHEKSVVTFDLYYCGIVLFDKHLSPHNYIVNF